MKRKLEMDDIRIGMYITILKGKTEERMVPGPNGPKFRMKEKDHYNGKILEVMNVLMPYIAVDVHESRGVRQDTIDLRHVEMMALTPEFILARLPNFELKRDNFLDEFIEDKSLENAGTNVEEIFKDL
jgi:hypothetical protein